MKKTIFALIFAMMLGFSVASCNGCGTGATTDADSTSVDTVLVDSTAVDSVAADTIAVHDLRGAAFVRGRARESRFDGICRNHGHPMGADDLLSVHSAHGL